jgi:uncharacterized protein (DUF1499 family)
MIKLYSVVITVIIFISFGCTRQYKVAKIVPGTTTLNQALDYLDQPVTSKKSQFDPSSHFYAWDDVSLQARDNPRYCNPP